MQQSKTRGVKIKESGKGGTASKAFKTSHALIIGINDYSNGITPLTTAINDAQHLATILEIDHGYNVHLVVEDVSKARLQRLLTKELQIAENDRLLLYFAGHGIALDGEDGPQGFLVPQDANSSDRTTLLPMTDLHNWLEGLACRHMLAIFDCCFAGVFRWAATRDVSRVGLEVIHQERFDRFLQSAAWQVLTSAAHNQKALDVVAGQTIGSRGIRETDGTQHSPFALALYDALQGDGDLIPKGDGDGVITATELYLYLRQQVEVGVEAVGHDQTPGLWQLNKHEHGEYIFLTPGHQLNLPPAPELTDTLNPWRGLKSYNKEHYKLFFGRDDEIADLAQQVTANPFTAVLGASGTGKSSLVKAGLLPHLERSETEQWHILSPLRPGRTPLVNLQAVLKKELEASVSTAQLAQDKSTFAEVVTGWANSHPQEKLLLVIDQLEELVTLCSDDKREQFLTLLAETVSQHPDIFRLIITIRTDFEPQFDDNTPLSPLWKKSRYIVPPMDQADLRQVIEGPASERVLYFDPPELVDTLISEVLQTPGALPLLSFTLSEMYLNYLQDTKRDDRALTQADYDALGGGVIGSLRNRANQEYENLPDAAHKATMQKVMLRMIAVEGGGLARRRVQQSELVYTSDAENERVQTVLNRLINARLLVTGEEEGEPTVEPAHDAMVLAWDKLLRWKQDAEGYLSLQRRLAQSTSEWDNAEPQAQKGLLWDDDPRLPQLEETLWPTGVKQKGIGGRISWARQVLMPNTDLPADTRWLNATEIQFVQTSVQTRARFWQRALSITTLVIVALTAISVFATFQAARARIAEADAVEQGNIASTNEARALTEEANAVTSEANAVAEASRAVAAEAEANMRATEVIARTTAEAQAVNAQATEVLVRGTAEADAIEQREVAVKRQAEAEFEAAVSQAQGLAIASQALAKENAMGAWLLAIAAGKTMTVPLAVEVLSEQVHQLPPPILSFTHDGPVTQAEWNEDESLILTRSDDGTAKVWDAASGELRHTLSHLGWIKQAEWNEDESLILTRSSDGNVKVWDAGSGELRHTLSHDDSVWQAEWNGIGSLILTQGGGWTAKVWDVGSGELRHTLFHDGLVTHAEWNEDESLILTSSNDDGTAKVWDASSGELRYTFSHDGWDFQTEWNKDGSLILTRSDDGAAKVWDASSGGLRHTFYHDDVITHAEWKENSSLILTRSDDGIVKVWDADSGELSHTLSHQGVSHAEWNRDGNLILTYGSGGWTVKIWDISNGELRHTLSNNGWVSYAEWNEDGSLILTSSANSEDKTVKVWDANSGELRHRLFHDDVDTQAEWNKDGSLILTRSDNSTEQTAKVWDVSSGELRHTLSHDDVVSHAEWNEDGSRILTSSNDGTAKVWDVVSSELRLTLSHLDGVSQVDWNGSGSLILISSNDGTAKVWDASSGELRHTLNGGLQANWNKDESLILTNNNDGTVKVWESSSGKLHYTLPHGDSAAGAKWNGDESLILTIGDGTVKVWDAGSGELRHSFFHGDDVTSLSAEWNENESLIMTHANSYSAIKVWDVSSGELRHTLFPYYFTYHTEWNKDGSLILTSSDDGAAKVWDVRSGEVRHTLSYDDGSVIHAEWNENESLILTLGDARSNDGTAKVWDARSGELRHTLSHDDWVSQAEWNDDGSLILTRSSDLTAKVWDAGSGELRHTLSHDDLVTHAEWNDDGSLILTRSIDGKVKVWDVPSGQHLMTFVSGGDGITDFRLNRIETVLIVHMEGRDSYKNTIYHYHMQMQAMVESACQHATRNFTWGEWQRYFPSQPYAPICAHLPVHPSVIEAGVVVDESRWEAGS